MLSKLRGNRGLTGLPCWYNKECYVTNRSPACECPNRLEEEAMFVANNGAWIRAKCAEYGVRPEHVQPCFLRGAAWCQAHCRDPCCAFCVTPDDGRRAAAALSDEGLAATPMPPSACRSKGCRPRCRRADCTCPDRPSKEAQAAKYDYKHWCPGPCRVYCDMRGPQWCLAHCENPWCLFGTPCCGQPDDGGGGVRACHYCPTCGRSEWPTDGPRPCAVPVHLAGVDDERQRREAAAAKWTGRCAQLSRLKAEAAAHKRAEAVKKCEKTAAAAAAKRREEAAVKKSDGVAVAVKCGRPPVATGEPEKTVTATTTTVGSVEGTEKTIVWETSAVTVRPEKRVTVRTEEAAVDRRDKTARHEFFSTTVRLIAAVRVRVGTCMGARRPRPLACVSARGVDVYMAIIVMTRARISI